nr:immunoglobulin light chain junction region [Macaca mulatta]
DYYCSSYASSTTFLF